MMREILTLENPSIAKEWDYVKNGVLQPERFTGGSNRKVWWRCKEGHSWFAEINKRFTYGRGCPYCSGNKVLPGYNDIATTHPQVAAEWDYEKNGDLRPEHLSIGADRKVWWLCNCGHSWEARTYSRKKHGCPACAGNILVVGVNDLMTINPIVSAEWKYAENGDLTPADVAANDCRKFWWSCKRGHSWQAAVSSRNTGKGCPYCSKRILLAGFNDLLTEAPELAAEWDYAKNHPLRPEMIIGTSHKAVWWKCKIDGCSWKSQIVNRRNGNGCPCCAGRLVLKGVNDLQTLRPDLATEWDFEKNDSSLPGNVTVQSHCIVWWKCPHGHSYRAAVSSRFRGSGCPYCVGKRPFPGETDLATIHPELLPEWDYEKNISLRPENFTAGSHKKIWWLCANGHSWNTQIYHRHIGCGCPYCSGLLVISGETDFGSLNPMLLSDWDYDRNINVSPDVIKSYSNKKYWWICEKGHHWRSTVGARHAGSGCPYCKGKIQMRTRLV